MRRTGFFLLPLLLVLALPLQAADQDQWRFSLTPYMWLPTINGNLNYELPPSSGEGRFNVEIGPNDYLAHLKFAMLLNGDMRKGRYSAVSDVLYMNLGSEASTVRSIDFAGGERLPVDTTVNSQTASALKVMLWTVAGGYTVNHDPDAPVDVIAGMRYIGIDTHAEWQLQTTLSTPGGEHTFPSSGSMKQRADLFDGIIGVRGRAHFGDRWTVPYYLDAGTGSAKWTWQAMTGISYGYRWGDVGLVYRHLAYDQKQPGILKNLNMSGPALAFSFRF